MDVLLKEIRQCRLCEAHLPHGPRPVFAVSPKSRVAIVGQAPGRIVHESGVPWQDKSGDRLREWLGVTEKEFYDTELFALLPMGFCYPGTGKSGDLPPRPECAPLWHHQVLGGMHGLQLVLLVGSYSQQYYLGKSARRNLTETVRNFQQYLPRYLPLPHPSPRNNIWIKKNPWFRDTLLPELRIRVQDVLAGN